MFEDSQPVMATAPKPLQLSQESLVLLQEQPDTISETVK